MTGSLDLAFLLHHTDFHKGTYLFFRMYPRDSNLLVLAFCGLLLSIRHRVPFCVEKCHHLVHHNDGRRHQRLHCTCTFVLARQKMVSCLKQERAATPYLSDLNSECSVERRSLRVCIFCRAWIAAPFWNQLWAGPHRVFSVSVLLLASRCLS